MLACFESGSSVSVSRERARPGYSCSWLARSRRRRVALKSDRPKAAWWSSEAGGCPGRRFWSGLLNWLAGRPLGSLWFPRRELRRAIQGLGRVGECFKMRERRISSFSTHATERRRTARHLSNRSRKPRESGLAAGGNGVWWIPISTRGHSAQLKKSWSAAESSC